MRSAGGVDEFQKVPGAHAIQVISNIRSDRFRGGVISRGESIHNVLERGASGAQRHDGLPGRVQHQHAFRVKQDALAAYPVGVQARAGGDFRARAGRYGVRDHRSMIRQERRRIKESAARKATDGAAAIRGAGAPFGIPGRIQAGPCRAGVSQAAWIESSIDQRTSHLKDNALTASSCKARVLQWTRSVAAPPPNPPGPASGGGGSSPTRKSQSRCSASRTQPAAGP